MLVREWLYLTSYFRRFSFTYFFVSVISLWLNHTTSPIWPFLISCTFPLLQFALYQITCFICLESSFWPSLAHTAVNPSKLRHNITVIIKLVFWSCLWDNHFYMLTFSFVHMLFSGIVHTSIFSNRLWASWKKSPWLVIYFQS